MSAIKGLMRHDSVGGLPFGRKKKKQKKPGEQVQWFGITTIRKIVMHPFYEAFFCCLIGANALVMALEAQHSGINVGRQLQNDSTEVAWPGAKDAFHLMDWIFGLAFCFEVVVKILVLRCHFFRELWNLIDLVIVVIWTIGEVIGNLGSLDPQLLRLARLARLLRMLRLVRRIQGFDALYLMTTAIRGSISILVWTSAMLLVIQMLLALLLNQFLIEFYFKDPHPEEELKEVWEYCGTFTRALYSMFEITLANWPTVGRALSENVSEVFMLFSVLHKLTIGFAIVGVVNGVFMQETFKVAATDDTIMLRQKETAARIHRRKMKLLFEHADTSGDGQLTLDEFHEVVSDPQIKTWLASMEIDAADVDNLYSLLDQTGEGRLSATELIRGMLKLKGPARAIDLANLMREHRLLIERLSWYEDPGMATLSVKSRGYRRAATARDEASELTFRGVEWKDTNPGTCFVASCLISTDEGSKSCDTSDTFLSV
eukprot:CAMPEP_0168398948 /NCGR_PEP_ID=MMETSP0228-20121227/21841_1 /TAXON_ID=133427 /ORGANISM="Protoceratium reticulatum, Strain CCCM 535 (=CCMP 1889)" /LENGTH=485 /DNA_ID=CAMNT_0008412465 /DNA_START=45 /DNA_END=1502 /DNA_ORIENTATION=+